jgi:pantothenate kinase
MSPGPTSDLDALIARIEDRLAETPGTRFMLGITGAPGAGKSTVAEMVRARVGAHRCAVVPMDGFHLANSIIDGTPLRSRKGAIDTFDVHGYIALLDRLRRRDEPIVYAPEYRRGLEEPIAGSIAIPRAIPVVITEGLYVLASQRYWTRIAGLLDETWFVNVAESDRLERLVARHVGFGMSPEVAREWANGPDALNASLVFATRDRADRVIEWGSSRRAGAPN